MDQETCGSDTIGICALSAIVGTAHTERRGHGRSRGEGEERSCQGEGNGRSVDKGDWGPEEALGGEGYQVDSGANGQYGDFG